MKNVIFMRHAKSDWKNDLTDHQRPLNARGSKDAPRIAQEIVNLKFIPELILCSDAVRTRQTWELISPYFPKTQTVFMRELYLASDREIISQIESMDNLIDTVMVLAHNPGITEVFGSFANIYVDNVPTAGVGCISCQTSDFKLIMSSEKKLQYFTYPKKLKIS